MSISWVTKLFVEPMKIGYHVLGTTRVKQCVTLNGFDTMVLHIPSQKFCRCFLFLFFEKLSRCYPCSRNLFITHWSMSLYNISAKWAYHICKYVKRVLNPGLVCAVMSLSVHIFLDCFENLYCLSSCFAMYCLFTEMTNANLGCPLIDIWHDICALDQEIVLAVYFVVE